jgi:hypothetical protein
VFDPAEANARSRLKTLEKVDFLKQKTQIGSQSRHHNISLSSYTRKLLTRAPDADGARVRVRGDRGLALYQSRIASPVVMTTPANCRR